MRRASVILVGGDEIERVRPRRSPGRGGHGGSLVIWFRLRALTKPEEKRAPGRALRELSGGEVTVG
jgi:hypothetical protein